MTDLETASVSDGRVRHPRALCWGLGALVAVVEVVVLLSVGPRTFYVGDDTLIQQVLSGSATGGDPSPYTVFVGYALSLALSALFRLAPGVPWWAVTSVAAMGLALAAVNRCLLGAAAHIIPRLCGQSPVVALGLGLAACLVAGMGVLSVCLLQIQFSYTATLCGVAAVLCMGCLLEEDFLCPGPVPCVTRRSAVATVCVLVGLSVSIRRDAGLVSGAFCVALWVVLCIRRKAKASEAGSARSDGLDLPGGLYARALPMLVAPTLLAGAILLTNAAAYSGADWVGFARANEARSSFVDYQRGTYEEHEELYRSVGWDECLYRLVRRLYFVDEVVNADALEAVNEGTAHDIARSNAISAFLTRSGVFADDHVFALCMVTIASLVVYLVVCDDRRWRIAGVLLLLCAGGLVCYLGLRGRLMSRSIVPVILPAIACLWAGMLAWAYERTCGKCSVLGRKERQKPRTVSRCLVPAILTAALSAVCLLPFPACLRYVTASGSAEARRSGNETIRLVDEYVSSHPDDTFMFGGDKYLDADLANAYDPPNKLYWGGWRYFAPWYRDAMSRAGFPDGFGEEDFLADDVYFVCLDDECTEMLVEHLESSLGCPIASEVVMQIGEAKVYALREA